MDIKELLRRYKEDELPEDELLRHLRLDTLPTQGKVPVARIHDDRRAALPSAIDMQAVAAHIHTLTGRRILLKVRGGGLTLISVTSEK